MVLQLKHVHFPLRFPSHSSSKLHRPHAPPIIHMPQFQLLVSLALGVEIDSTHTSFNLVEAYIVETFEACACNSLDAMVGHQKVLLPSHEEVLALCVVLKREVG